VFPTLKVQPDASTETIKTAPISDIAVFLIMESTSL
jgi:hypothetical protein